jgi:hypothetical protein
VRIFRRSIRGHVDYVVRSEDRYLVSFPQLWQARARLAINS